MKHARLDADQHSHRAFMPARVYGNELEHVLPLWPEYARQLFKLMRFPKFKSWMRWTTQAVR